MILISLSKQWFSENNHSLRNCYYFTSYVLFLDYIIRFKVLIPGQLVRKETSQKKGIKLMNHLSTS